MSNDQADPFAELRKIKADYIDKTLRWYATRSACPRLAFRVSGVVIIVTSLALPFLAAWAAHSPDNKIPKLSVPIASFIIAVVTGLNAFFGWQKSWEKRMTIQLTLEGAIALWQTKIDAAQNIADPAKAYETALEATQNLVKSTQALTIGETAEWFRQQKLPDVAAKK